VVQDIAARPGLRGAAAMGGYAASKAVVVSLTQSLADECRPFAVTVNAIATSVIDTPANRAAMPTAKHADWVQPLALARVAAFLASDAARDISGDIVQCYGNS